MNNYEVIVHPKNRFEPPVILFKCICFAALALLSMTSWSQQVADTEYEPPIIDPAYQEGKGSIVFLDEAHQNFHTKDGRYQGFTKVLEADGYRVESSTLPFTPSHLAQCKILVISNALHPSNKRNWSNPVYSAFSKEEISAVTQWVTEGGNLFLIADHMPMGGAAKELAAAFGFQFTNGFALKNGGAAGDVFQSKDQTLIESIITKGRNSSEEVSKVASFTGQAFNIPSDATGILTFPKGFMNLLPEKAWQFDKNTPKNSIEGWYQGAFKTHGNGKIVVFGEAAMFTTQVSGKGKAKFGMNHKKAKQNYQLLLNIIHWLDGLL